MFIIVAIITVVCIAGYFLLELKQPVKAAVGIIAFIGVILLLLNYFDKIHLG
jgi:hypothetical protein